MTKLQLRAFLYQLGSFAILFISFRFLIFFLMLLSETTTLCLIPMIKQAVKIPVIAAGGIANALPLLGRDPFLVVNGDVFTEIDFAHLALNPQYLAHLVMVDNPPQHPQGDFALIGDRLMVDGVSKLTFSGVGVYHPDLFVTVKPGEAAKLAPLLKEAMNKGLVTGQYYQGLWHDIGTPERLDALDKQLS